MCKYKKATSFLGEKPAIRLGIASLVHAGFSRNWLPEENVKVLWLLASY